MSIEGYDPNEVLNIYEAADVLGTVPTLIRQMYREWGIKYTLTEKRRLVFFRSDLEKQMAERPRKSWRNAPAYRREAA